MLPMCVLSQTVISNNSQWIVAEFILKIQFNKKLKYFKMPKFEKDVKMKILTRTNDFGSNNQ